MPQPSVSSESDLECSDLAVLHLKALSLLAVPVLMNECGIEVNSRDCAARIIASQHASAVVIALSRHVDRLTQYINHLARAAVGNN